MRINQPVTAEEYVLPHGEVIITRTDAQGCITYANQAFLTSSEFSLAECMGQPQNIVRHPDMPPEAFADLWRTIRTGKPWTGIVKNRRKSGGFYWVRANVTPMLEGGRIEGFMSVRVRPTAEEIRAAEHLYRQMRAGSAPHLRLREGELLDTRLGGRLRGLLRTSFMSVAWAGLASIGALFLGLAAVISFAPSSASAVWALSIAGVIIAAALGVHLQARTAAPLRIASTVAVRVIGGELQHDFPASRDAEVGRLTRALNQMNSKLVGVLKDARLGVNAVADGAREIMEANEDLGTRATSRAAGLEQTAASMEQLTATVKQTADSAQEANELTLRASQVTQQSREVVHDMVGTMHDIAGSSRKIADIVTLLDSIAFQTNLLALNAAVEAARAGEQGRGFAVVAQEVRALALRSTTSAKDIKDLINTSLLKIDEGSRLAVEAGAAMDQVVGAVGHVATIMTDMMGAAREQSAGIDQVNQAVMEMDRITQEDAAMAERVIQVAQQLTEQAGRAIDAMSAFKLEVQGVQHEPIQSSRAQVSRRGAGNLSRAVAPPALRRAG